jgi:hypothetical protein
MKCSACSGKTARPPDAERRATAVSVSAKMVMFTAAASCEPFIAYPLLDTLELPDDSNSANLNRSVLQLFELSDAAQPGREVGWPPVARRSSQPLRLSTTAQSEQRSLRFHAQTTEAR